MRLGLPSNVFDMDKIIFFVWIQRVIRLLQERFWHTLAAVARPWGQCSCAGEALGRAWVASCTEMCMTGACAAF
jgi:hypothetical protein